MRIERWKRAKEFGFKPSSKVRDLVIAHSDDDRYTQWYEAYLINLLRSLLLNSLD